MKCRSVLAGLLILLALFTACSAPAPHPTLEAQAGSWQQVGGVVSKSRYNNNFSNFPSLASDGTNHTVAFFERSIDLDIRVKTWDGTNWINVGNALSGSSAPNSSAVFPSLALDSSGHPIVAWPEWDGSSFNIYIRRWTGLKWQNLGTPPFAKSYNIYGPSLSFVNGSLDVAWQQGSGDNNINNLYVKHYVTNDW